MYTKFCSDVNIAPEAVSTSLLQMMLIFQRNIDYVQTFKHIFPKTFVDWDTADSIRKSKTYCNANLWVSLSKYLSCTNTHIIQEHGLLTHFHSKLRESDIEVDAEHLIKIYVLMHINNTQVMNMLETYFSQVFNRDIHQKALKFFSLLCNEQFTQEQYTLCAIDVMTQCLVANSALLMQELELIQTQSNTLTNAFEQRNIRACLGRPKLRSKLQQHTKDQIFEMDQWNVWSDNIRFPNTFSTTHKKKIYFLMSQMTFDPTPYVQRVVHNPELYETVLKFAVKQPDTDILYACIMGTRLVEEPFSELHSFRNECFKSFSLEQKQKLKLNDILHLDVASYQHTWKTIWKLIFPVLSIQIIKDVEYFVKHTPINHCRVAKLLFEQDFTLLEPTPADKGSLSARTPPPPHEEERRTCPAATPSELPSAHTTGATPPSHAASSTAGASSIDLLELQTALAHRLHHTPAPEADDPHPEQSDPADRSQQDN